MIDIVDHLMEEHGDGYEPRAGSFTDMADGNLNWWVNYLHIQYA